MKKSVVSAMMSVLLMALFVPSSFADIMVERATRSGGISGMMANKSTEKAFIRGLKKRTESSVKFTGKVLSILTREKKTVHIYDIKKDLEWEIDPAEKTYLEHRLVLPVFTEITENDQDVMTQDEPPEMADQQGQAEVKIIKNEFNVKKTGKRKTINDFKCQRVIVTWLMEVEDLKTKEQKKSLMTIELWNTEETALIRQLKKEEDAFNRAYLKQLGVQSNPADMQQFGLTLIAGMASASGDELKQKLAGIEGYPIVTSVKWEGTPEKEEKAQQGTRRQEDGGSGGELDVAKELGGLFGGFVKKLMKPEKKKSSELELIFESYTEIKRIDDASLADNLFEVPGEFKKVTLE